MKYKYESTKNNQKKSNFSIFLFLSVGIILTLIPLSSAVTLDIGTTLNTTVSNSSITITSIVVYVDLAKVDTRSIELHNASWTNGELIANLTTIINWTTVNRNVDSSAFPRFTSSSSTSKTFSSSLSALTGTYRFTVNSCESIGNIVHKSSGGTVRTSYQKGSYICANGAVSVLLNNVSDGDTLTIDYACSSFTNIGFKLIMLLSALAIVIFIAYTVYKDGWEGVSVGKILVIAVVVIVCLVLWQVSGQNLGAACPVST